MTLQAWFVVRSFYAEGLVHIKSLLSKESTGYVTLGAPLETDERTPIVTTIINEIGFCTGHFVDNDEGILQVSAVNHDEPPILLSARLEFSDGAGS